MKEKRNGEKTGSVCQPSKEDDHVETKHEKKKEDKIKCIRGNSNKYDAKDMLLIENHIKKKYISLL